MASTVELGPEPAIFVDGGYQPGVEHSDPLPALGVAMRPHWRIVNFVTAHEHRASRRRVRTLRVLWVLAMVAFATTYIGSEVAGIDLLGVSFALMATMLMVSILAHRFGCAAEAQVPVPDTIAPPASS